MAGGMTRQAGLVLDSVNQDVERLSEALAMATGIERARIASELLVVSGSARIPLAKAYFRAVLQDSTVQTAIGPVKIIGGTWKEMRRGMAHDGIKAALVPLVPTILSVGDVVGGRQLPGKDRTDYAAFYFFRLNEIHIGDHVVDAGVTVGERPDGLVEYKLNAYGLGHSKEARWALRVSTAKKEPPAGLTWVRATPPDGGSGLAEPTLDDIMGYQDDECNIVILAVRNQSGEPVLDSVGEASPLERARAARDLTAKVAAMGTAKGLERLRLAKEIQGVLGVRLSPDQHAAARPVAQVGLSANAQYNAAITSAKSGPTDFDPRRKFYVTVAREGRGVGKLAGPFDTFEEANASLHRVREVAHEVDPRSAFDAFGVTGVTADQHGPGVLNERLGIQPAGKVAKQKTAIRAVVVERNNFGVVDVHAQGDFGSGLERLFSGVVSVDAAIAMLVSQGVARDAIKVRHEEWDGAKKRYVPTP